MEPSKDYVFKYKGFYFGVITTLEHVASLEDFEINDSDIFIATYPKSGVLEAKVFSRSTQHEIFLGAWPTEMQPFMLPQEDEDRHNFCEGTVWTQNILALIMCEGHRNGTENMEMMDRIPWLEYNIKSADFATLPSPRIFATHLPYYLVPRDMRNKRGRCYEFLNRTLRHKLCRRSGPVSHGKCPPGDSCNPAATLRLTDSMDTRTSLKMYMIIYVTRNPKDVMVSYYHFSKFMNTLEKIPDFDLFMERFLAGKVLASSWMDHVAGWYSHAEDFNILFLTYEEMKKDLRSAVLKICKFLGKKLSEEEVDSVVRQATFENMRKDPRANYENLPEELAEKNKGKFLRKGTVGDWKNIMTVAQSERFDKVLKERMKTLPIKFVWDINDEM